MQQTTDHPTIAPESGLAAAALRASAWAGEEFLHAEEDPEQVLAPGTARRRALDDALAEIEAGVPPPAPPPGVRPGGTVPPPSGPVRSARPRLPAHAACGRPVNHVPLETAERLA